MSAIFHHVMRYEWVERNPIKLVRQSAKRERTPDILELAEFFNNSTLGMVRLEQMVGGYPFWGTEMNNPDFSAVAKAIGFHAERVERKGDVASAIERAFAHPGPALVDITTDPNAMSMPPKSTYEEARGFALAMTRMVLDNRGDQVLDLVKDNIRGMV